MTDERDAISEPADPAEPELVVISGMSGAGRSEAIHTFEDLGYFCIDNLPPSFLRQLVDLAHLPGSRVRRLAVVSDLRAREFFEELAGELKRLEDGGVHYHVLFLEADDESLVQRFKETRRRHPLSDDESSLLDGINAERESLDPIRSRADVIIDTTDMRPQELRAEIRDTFFGKNLARTLAITVNSFGFKYGVPSDADIVMDVRFLPNPYYDSQLRPLTGLDGPVEDFVLGRSETQAFLERWFALLEMLVPGYVMEGKHHLSIALGCTGGMHRSVVLAEKTAAFLCDEGYRVAVSHRDIGKDRAAR